MSAYDLTFLKPFLEGIRETLQIQCNTEVIAQKPVMKNVAPPMPFDIAAIIGLVSSTFKGSMTICFPEEVYLELISQMLGEKYTEITPDLHDGVAELLNIIFGHAKRVLNEVGHDFQKALPTVITGKSLQTRQLSDNPVIILPFKCSKGEFFVEFVFGE